MCHIQRLVKKILKTGFLTLSMSNSQNMHALYKFDMNN